MRSIPKFSPPIRRGISVDRIGELINYDIRALIGAAEAGSAA